jgi:hypothetical protein
VPTPAPTSSPSTSSPLITSLIAGGMW